MGARYASVLLLLAATPALAASKPSAMAWVNRLTWGVSALPIDGPQPGSDAWLQDQLFHPEDRLPPGVAAQIDAMQISHRPLAELMTEDDAAHNYGKSLTDPVQKDAAAKAHRDFVTNLTGEAATRFLLRAVYGADQIRSQLTWFWLNHFNVVSLKTDVRVGDYEETLRDHSLGKFRDLLEATLKHPAMIRYLDNDQNAANHINENYAREIMELHSMGVGSGYTQKDVQELARILTGITTDFHSYPMKISAKRQSLYIHEGVFTFNPDHHDFGDKVFLGQTIKGSGFGEVEQALDILAKSPATARYISGKLALYFMGEQPSQDLLNKMVASWKRSDGDIAVVLQAMFRSRDFRQSLGTALKDPVHYAVSAVRLTYGDQTIVNAKPIIIWLNRMGEGLYGRDTPDGYPLIPAAWTAPGQMLSRFETAQQLANKPALFTPQPINPAVTSAMPPAMTADVGSSPAPADATPPNVPSPVASPPVPQLRDSAYFKTIEPQLSARTKAALAQAKSPQQWNALFLSSPEFMRR